MCDIKVGNKQQNISKNESKEVSKAKLVKRSQKSGVQNVKKSWGKRTVQDQGEKNFGSKLSAQEQSKLSTDQIKYEVKHHFNTTKVTHKFIVDKMKKVNSVCVTGMTKYNPNLMSKGFKEIKSTFKNTWDMSGLEQKQVKNDKKLEVLQDKVVNQKNKINNNLDNITNTINTNKESLKQDSISKSEKKVDVLEMKKTLSDMKFDHIKSKRGAIQETFENTYNQLQGDSNNKFRKFCSTVGAGIGSITVGGFKSTKRGIVKIHHTRKSWTSSFSIRKVQKSNISQIKSIDKTANKLVKKYSKTANNMKKGLDKQVRNQKIKNKLSTIGTYSAKVGKTVLWDAPKALVIGIGTTAIQGLYKTSLITANLVGQTVLAVGYGVSVGLVGTTQAMRHPFKAHNVIHSGSQSKQQMDIVDQRLNTINSRIENLSKDLNLGKNKLMKVDTSSHKDFKDYSLGQKIKLSFTKNGLLATGGATAISGVKNGLTIDKINSQGVSMRDTQELIDNGLKSGHTTANAFVAVSLLANSVSVVGGLKGVEWAGDEIKKKTDLSDKLNNSKMEINNQVNHNENEINSLDLEGKINILTEKKLSNNITNNEVKELDSLLEIKSSIAQIEKRTGLKAQAVSFGISTAMVGSGAVGIASTVGAVGIAVATPVGWALTGAILLGSAGYAINQSNTIMRREREILKLSDQHSSVNHNIEQIESLEVRGSLDQNGIDLLNDLKVVEKDIRQLRIRKDPSFMRDEQINKFTNPDSTDTEKMAAKAILEVMGVDLSNFNSLIQNSVQVDRVVSLENPEDFNLDNIDNIIDQRHGKVEKIENLERLKTMISEEIKNVPTVSNVTYEETDKYGNVNTGW